MKRIVAIKGSQIAIETPKSTKPKFLVVCVQSCWLSEDFAPVRFEECAEFTCFLRLEEVKLPHVESSVACFG